jgi:hypothetical protein
VSIFGYIRDARTEGWKMAMQSFFFYTKPALLFKRLFICSIKGHDNDEWTCFTCFKEMN